MVRLDYNITPHVYFFAIHVQVCVHFSSTAMTDLTADITRVFMHCHLTAMTADSTLMWMLRWLRCDDCDG